MIDARDDRAIQRRREELAGEAFDDGDEKWLRGQDLLDLAAATIRYLWSDQYTIDQHVTRLREHYIKECADLYRQQAEDEQRERAEIEHENARGDEGKERAWSGR